MRELDQLSRERLPQAMDLGQERNRRLYQVARVASAIAQSASLLEDAVSAAPLTRDERRAFAKHAEALRSRARTLAEQAQHLSPTAIRARAAQLEETCAGCHQRFRIPRTARD